MFLWLLPCDHRVAISAFGLIPSHPSISGILTSMFMHADLGHLVWNMFFLWLFGPNVEDALGWLEYTIFYFGSGFAAALLHVVVVQTLIPMAADAEVVGASGAIAGVLGIFAIRFYKTGIRIWYFVFLFYILRWGTFTIPVWIGLGIWFLRQAAGGVFGILHPQSGGVAYWSHIGGMVFGMVLAHALRMGLEASKEYLMADARSSLEHGTAWAAEENLRALLERDPENADMHGELAKAYAMQHDSDHALAHYRQSVELHLRRGEHEKAVARFAEIKYYYPDARLGLKSEYQLATYLMEVGCEVPALQLLENIASTHLGAPEAEVALIKAGELHLNVLDDPGSAVQCYERFLREYPYSTYCVMAEKSLADAREKLSQDRES